MAKSRPTKTDRDPGCPMRPSPGCRFKADDVERPHAVVYILRGIEMSEQAMADR